MRSGEEKRKKETDNSNAWTSPHSGERFRFVLWVERVDRDLSARLGGGQTLLVPVLGKQKQENL